jgi:mannose-1-phosphate guanylyltransferase
MKHVYVAIMAGGIGSRFWPQSRSAKPKQFLDILDSGKTLLQMTYDRFINICPPENINIVTLDEYEYLVKEQIPRTP